MRSVGWIGACVVLVACGAEVGDAPRGLEGPVTVTCELRGEGLNGVHVPNGTNLNGLSPHIGSNMNGHALNGSNLNGSNLNGTNLNGQNLNGLTLAGGPYDGLAADARVEPFVVDGARIQLEAAEPAGGPPLYRVWLLDDAGEAVPLCGGAPARLDGGL